MRESLALVIGTLVLASPARADHTSLHATATGQVATTDNLFAAGSDGDRQADMFFTIRPGLLFAYDDPRMIHDFNAEAEVTEYVMHSDEPSFTGRAGWRSLFLIGPRTQVNMAINTGTGVLTALSARASSDETTVTIAPAGKVYVEQADASQSLAWVSGKHTRVIQGILGRYSFTDDRNGTQSDTREVGGNLGFERTFRNNAVLLDASVSYLKLQALAPVNSIMGNAFVEQVNPRGLVTVRHDFDKAWSANAEGGIVFVNPVGTRNTDLQRKGGTFGLYGAQLAYTDVQGRAALSVRRTVAPNLYLAQNTLDDQVNFQVAMPLPWIDNSSSRNPKVAAMGSMGVARSQAIDAVTGMTQGEIKAAHLDVTLAWTPKPGVTYGARYELVYQSDGTMLTQTLPAYYRNTLLFTFALRYPDRVAAELPKRNRSMRSDRKDLMPIGSEPMMPDVLEDGQSDDRGRD